MPATPLPAKLSALLARPNPSVIALVRPDGQPISVATWYLWENGRILVNMDEGRKRLAYLRNEPRVSVTVFDGANWYGHVSLQGKATEILDDPDLVDVDRISQYYIGTPYTGNRARGRVSAWIDVERWHVWDIPIDD